MTTLSWGSLTDSVQLLSTYAMRGNTQGIERAPVAQGTQLQELIEKAKIRVNQRFLQRAVKELRRVLGSSTVRLYD